MLRQRLEDDVGLFREDGFLRLLVVFYFDELAGVFDFCLKPQQLFKCMVEKHDFFRCLVRQHFPDLFKALWPLEERDQEDLHVMVRPHVALLVLHLVLQRVLDKFELLLQNDLSWLLGVEVQPRLRNWCVVLLRAQNIVGDLGRQGT